jgi:tetratricopeptide (TPR) repeat protein
VAKKKRVTRKQLLKEPDEFFTFSGKAIQFLSKNQKSFIGVLVGVVVVALAFAGFRYFSGVSERKAYAMFEQARSSYVSGLLASGKPSSQEETIKKLETVLDEYPSTTAARFSLLVYGDVSYQQGDYDKAIELYNKALGRFKGEEVIPKLIWNGLGHAYEGKRDYTSAAANFREITVAQGEFMKADAFYNLGRMLEAIDDRKGALEAYEQAVQLRDNPTSFSVAEEKILRLKAELEPVKSPGSSPE